MGGLPLQLTDAAVKELLASFGALRAFNLVRDRDGGSKGYAFCEYSDPSITDAAIAGLSSMIVGGRALTVRRAKMTETNEALQELIDQQQAMFTGRKLPAAGPQPAARPAAQHSAPASASTLQPAPSRMVRLANMAERQELVDDEDYDDFVQETRQEVVKYGKLKDIKVPRPGTGPGGSDLKGVGLVFLEYEDTKAAARACAALDGRRFGGNVLRASYFDQGKYEANQLE